MSEGDSHTDSQALRAAVAERALRASEAMRDVAEQVAHIGSWAFDLASLKATWSPEMYRLFGLAPDTYDGGLEKLMERIHPDDRAAVQEATARSVATGRPVPVEYRVVLPDGSERILRGEGRTEVDTDGKPETMVGYYQDVTESRRAEAARQEIERAESELLDRLNEAQRLARIGSWEWDLLSDRVWWSDETYRIFGVSPEEFVPGFEANSDFIHPDDLAAYAAAFEHSLDTGIALDLDVRLIPGTGGMRFCSARGQVIDDEAGRPVRFVGTVMDITERKRAEDEIHRLNDELEQRVVSRTAQLEATNKELEAFAYSISHDLRAPLRAIDGFSAMVAEDAGEKLDEEDREHLRRVRAGAQRMAELIDDLLDLSRASRQELLRQEVDVSEIAVSILDELRDSHPARSVEIVVAPSIIVHADPTLLRDILANLLGNAWKFTGGHDAARIEVGAVKADGESAYFVRDDGAGFDMACAGHLFGAFQRMHGPDEFEGNGIGLATVKRLVTLHGGRIWAEAEVEKGATFFFTLPDAQAGDRRS